MKPSKKKNSSINYEQLVRLIKTDFKQALNRLDQLTDVNLKEELILNGEKDLDRNTYLQIRNHLINDQLLKELLKETGSNDFERKKKAVYTLLEINTVQAIDYLISFLYDDNIEIRKLVIEELSKLDHPKVVTTLVSYLDFCNDTRTLQALKKAFLNLDSQSISELLKLLNSDNTNYVNLAIEVLGKIGGDEVINPLIELLDHLDPMVRINAVKSLAKFDSTKVDKALLTKVEDENPQVRAQVAIVLGQLANQEAAPYLYQMLTDESGIVRHNACDALLNLGQKGIKYLILAADQEETPNDVIQALNRLDIVEIIKITKELCNSEGLQPKLDKSII